MNMSMTTPTTPGPLERARQAFEAEQLPWPPVPDDLARQLEEQPMGPVFSSRPLPANPYEIERYTGEILGGAPVDDYAVVGFAGYGTNSWAAHFYLVRGALALFVQVPWGGAFTDADDSRAELARLFDWAGDLLAQVQGAASAHRIEAGERLLVVASRFVEPGWAWVPPAGRGAAPTALNPADGMLAAIAKSVAGRLTPST